MINNDYLWMRLPGDIPAIPAQGFSYNAVKAYARQVGASLDWDAYSGYTITMGGEARQAPKLEQAILMLQALNASHPNLERAPVVSEPNDPSTWAGAPGYVPEAAEWAGL